MQKAAEAKTKLDACIRVNCQGKGHHSNVCPSPLKISDIRKRCFVSKNLIKVQLLLKLIQILERSLMMQFMMIMFLLLISEEAHGLCQTASIRSLLSLPFYLSSILKMLSAQRKTHHDSQLISEHFPMMDAHSLIT